MSSHETTAGSSVTVHGVAAIFGWNFGASANLAATTPRAAGHPREGSAQGHVA